LWGSLLTGLSETPEQSDLLMPATPAPLPILRFEALDMLGLPLSVPDDLWRARDVHAPQTDEEELPLL